MCSFQKFQNVSQARAVSSPCLYHHLTLCRAFVPIPRQTRHFCDKVNVWIALIVLRQRYCLSTCRLLCSSPGSSPK